MPMSPASVVSLTMTSLTRVIRLVDVETGCGNGADRKYVSSAVIFIDRLRRDDTLARLAGREGGAMRRFVVVVMLLLPLFVPGPGMAAPERHAEIPAGTLTWGLHVRLATKRLDPRATA